MDREVILITGLTGWGKSLWGRLYTQSHPRLLVYDPAGDFSVLFLPVDMIYEEVVGRRTETFRLGSFLSDDVDPMGCMAFGVGDCLLVVEEASSVFSKRAVTLEGWSKRLVFLGRHRRCSLMVLAQRAMSIPIDFRSQANRLISFCQHEADDLNWLRGFFGREVWALPTMPKWECLDWHDGRMTRYSIKSQAEKLLGVQMGLDKPTGEAYKYSSE